MKTLARTLLPAALVVLAFGCVEESPDLTPAERETLREYILTEAPHPQHELDIRFESRVRLIGYDISVENITPGQAFDITWYWQVDRRLTSGWMMFTHLADASGQNRQNEDSNGPVRERYQPSRWREGEWVRDPQHVTIPADWHSDRVVFYMGFWNEDHRLAVTSGPNDGENRARAASIPVLGTLTEAETTDAPAVETAAVPTYNAIHTTGPVTIDGRLDETDWTSAHATSRFVDTVGGGPGPFTAASRVMWDEQNVYVAFEVLDDYLHNTITERDGHLWEQDAVEIMVDPDGDGLHYFELQVSPTGNIFETAYDSRRVPQPIGHADWDSHMVARANVEGAANDDAADRGYTVELSIPWSAFRYGDMPETAAPPAGSSWRFNFYVMDSRPDGSQRGEGWSPTLTTDYHVPARFGRITFLGAQPSELADGIHEPVRVQLTPEQMAQIRPLPPMPILMGPGGTRSTLSPEQVDRAVLPTAHP
jgi:hypothetical protein